MDNREQLMYDTNVKEIDDKDDEVKCRKISIGFDSLNISEDKKKILKTNTNKSNDLNANKSDLMLGCISESFKQEQRLNKNLKRWFCGVILFILLILTISINVIVYFIGFGMVHYSEWTIRLFITGVFIEIIAVVKIIVSSLFPKDDKKISYDFINNCLKEDESNYINKVNKI